MGEVQFGEFVVRTIEGGEVGGMGEVQFGEFVLAMERGEVRDVGKI